MSGFRRAADLVVLGGGIVGLSCARALADAGAKVTVLSARMCGEASSASAAILAPALETGSAQVRAFAFTARDSYPGLVEELASETGVLVSLNLRGIVEPAFDEASAERLSAAMAPDSAWLDSAALAGEEPALRHAWGALLHHRNGAVDNLSLLHALRRAVGTHPHVKVIEARALRLQSTAQTLTVHADSGERIDGERVVVANGAWVRRLRGLPRPIPVEPVRGQIVMLSAAPVQRVCYAAHQYLVPRPGGHTLVGSTMERVGFTPGTADADIATMIGTAVRTVPALAGTRELSRWSGLRPVTPDLLPIIGPDPAEPRLLYACGHSRNGILLGPLTGEVVARLVSGAEPHLPIDAFSVERFRPT